MSTIAPFLDLLNGVQSLLFITGAGVSADSGLPTYRGIGGLYNQTGTEDDIPIEVALSGTMLRKRPAIAWKYIAQIEAACRGAKFNRAHEVIALLESRFERVCVLTQNVDGFHRDAGSKNVIDIHGDVHDLFCVDCGESRTVVDYAGLDIPPTCKTCGGLIRPKVVLFGEMLPEDKISRLYDELELGFDLVCSIGTTSVFPYIAGPVMQAARAGIPTVEINPGETEVSHAVALKISRGAAATLDELWRAL